MIRRESNAPKKFLRFSVLLLFRRNAVVVEKIFSVSLHASVFFVSLIVFFVLPSAEIAVDEWRSDFYWICCISGFSDALTSAFLQNQLLQIARVICLAVSTLTWFLLTPWNSVNNFFSCSKFSFKWDCSEIFNLRSHICGQFRVLAVLFQCCLQVYVCCFVNSFHMFKIIVFFVSVILVCLVVESLNSIRPGICW